jgi:hypothetical protein
MQMSHVTRWLQFAMSHERRNCSNHCILNKHWCFDLVSGVVEEAEDAPVTLRNLISSDLSR